LPRTRVLKEADPGTGPVIYWMSRDQRADDNWALLYAQSKAVELSRPLEVVFCLIPSFLEATARHYGFMLRGLAVTAEKLAAKNISFTLLEGNPGDKVAAYANSKKAAALFTDFDPLKIKRKWKEDALKGLKVPFIEVDAHNIVPCLVASGKQEFAARTIRPKIEKLLPEWLVEMPALKKHPHSPGSVKNELDADKIIKRLSPDMSVPEVDWIKPGETEAKRAATLFAKGGLPGYDENRNDPNKDGQSDLSPYLHFGQLSCQRLALKVQKAKAPDEDKRAFLEEMIVRRELSDNFCWYNRSYDSFAGFPDWARKTLDEHRDDPREYTYALKQFEEGNTHDDLWNAAQMEMVRTGKMHGYMRMYWAKKILEWTKSPEEAIKFAIYLNDRYELDGRDPNGYTGVAWSIGGVHDRAWSEREVFGKIRFMSRSGCERKFDVDKYVSRNLKGADDE